MKKKASYYPLCVWVDWLSKCLYQFYFVMWDWMYKCLYPKAVHSPRELLINPSVENTVKIIIDGEWYNDFINIIFK